jgi:hypothetical protein
MIKSEKKSQIEVVAVVWGYRRRASVGTTFVIAAQNHSKTFTIQLIFSGNVVECMAIVKKMVQT